MRLIDAPIGIFRFDGELVLKTEYHSENKQSGKYIPDCYIVRTGEYFWGGAKTANELINLDVEPVDFAELLPTATDMISRQAVLGIAFKYCPDDDGTCSEAGTDLRDMLDELENLPSTQPERIKGRWEVASTGYSGFMRCSVCKAGCCGDYRSMKFCLNCGVKMEVNDESN